MLGFLADAKTTDIKVDGMEIAEAEWFHLQSAAGEIAVDTEYVWAFD